MNIYISHKYKELMTNKEQSYKYAIWANRNAIFLSPVNFRDSLIAITRFSRERAQLRMRLGKICQTYAIVRMWICDSEAFRRITRVHADHA